MAAPAAASMTRLNTYRTLSVLYAQARVAVASSSRSRLCLPCLAAAASRKSSTSAVPSSTPPAASPRSSYTARRAYSAQAFQSYPLYPNAPPPPRNEAVPATSIAKPSAPPASIPKVSEARAPPGEAPSETSEPTRGRRPPEAQQPWPESGAAAISEGEAQTSRPAPSSSTSSTTLTPTSSPEQAGAAAPPASPSKTPRPPSRLRSRKAVMKLTPAAVAQLRAILEGPSPKMIKVGVRNRGCSGLAYHLQQVEKPDKFDEEVVQDGVMVLVDSKALFSIIGSEMDWVEDRLSQRFVFRNPNIKEECGCGESFMV